MASSEASEDCFQSSPSLLAAHLLGGEWILFPLLRGKVLWPVAPVLWRAAFHYPAVAQSRLEGFDWKRLKLQSLHFESKAGRLLGNAELRHLGSDEHT